MSGADSQATWQQVTKLALSIAAVVGIVIVPRLPPLGVTRPNVAPPVENRYASSQNVDARLWQDPFEAVDAERERRRNADKGDPKIAEMEAKRTSADFMRQDITRQLTGTPAPPVVLLTFVPGGPYPENAEGRRRTRYATLSGLRAAGLIPVDAEHIGYFETGIESREVGLPPLVVYEWLRAPSSQTTERLDQVLLLWLDERIFGSATVHKTAVLLREMGFCGSGGRLIPARTVMLGPAESGSVRSLVEAVGNLPIADVACVSPTFVLSTATVPDDYIVPGRLLDPGGVREANRGGARPGGPPRDTMGSATMEQWLGGAGLRFSRVLPTDDALMQELIAELAARDVDLHAPGTKVAILSEWDTLYGRRGAELVSEVICKRQREGSDHSWCGGRVRLFEYPRGLDGVIPGRETKKPEQQSDKTVISGLPRHAEPGERAEGTSQADYVRRVAVELDRMINSPARARSPLPRDRRVVIGVLGSDVYDKLLILRALRPQHPDATFFTFDLDTRMLHGDEFNWARNLLVVAPVGLGLRPELQGSIPPFRDTYQTAYFLSAQAAVDLARIGVRADTQGPIFPAVWKPRVFEIGRDREFDLSVAGATGPCHSALHCLDVTPRPSSQLLHFGLTMRDWWWVAAIALAGVGLLLYSSGIRDALKSSLMSWPGRITWVSGVAGGAALFWFFIWLSNYERVRPEPFSWDGAISMWPTEIARVATFLLAVIFSAIAARVVRKAAKDMANRYGLEPGQSASSDDVTSPRIAVNGHQNGTANGHPLPMPPAATSRLKALGRETWEAITLRRFDDLAKEVPTRSAALWAEYRRQSRGLRQLVRVCLSILATYVVVLCLMIYFGFPHRPARGEAIVIADGVVLFLLCAPVVLWLQMYVVDVIRLCDKVTSALAAERATYWPSEVGTKFWDVPPAKSPAPATHGAAAPADTAAAGAGNGAVQATSSATLVASSPAPGGESRVMLAATGSSSATSRQETRTEPQISPKRDDDVSYWLDIRFTADWTARLSWLVYLPLIVICLMMVARSRFFDDWDTPPGLYLGVSLSLAYLVGCVVLLMRRATKLRASALRHLQTRMRRLTGAGDPKAEIDRVKLMIEDVARIDVGAFAPVTRQPIFGALAVMFGGAGITAIVQYVMGVN